MPLPKESRFKLAILFILQGIIVFILSFTRDTFAVIVTSVILGVVFSLLIHRSLSLHWKNENDTSLIQERDDLIYPAKYKDEREFHITGTQKSEQEAEIQYLAGVYQQMTEKVNDQKHEIENQKLQIEEEKNKIEVILRSVPDGVVTINIIGLILTWNPGANIITEWEDDEVLYKAYHNILYLSDKNGKPIPKEESPIEECFKTKKTVERSHIFLRTRLKKEIPIDINVSPIFDEKRNVTAVVSTFRDISKKWEIEKLKEDFLAMVTHDLKSPLAAIVGYTNLLLHPKAKFTPSEQKNFLNSILGSVKILQFLIDNILESARLESGKIVYQFESFELQTLLSEIDMMFSPIVDSKKVKLEFIGESLWVYGDREKLREVINNLISNAIKFTPENGKITITSKQKGESIILSVSDTGKGIPESELPKLFKKFVQVKGERRGTGLGLYIVKRIIEDHDQTVEVNSTLGKGTEFAFTLKPGTPKDTKVYESNITIGKRKGKILIVEDNPEVSNLIRYYLKASGYETIQAFSGEEAFKLFQKDNPDLMTLDYNLPDIDGEELVKRINSNSAGIDTPIILITSNAKESWDIHYDCLLNKPLDESRLLAEVERLLKKKRSKVESVEILQ